MVSSPQKKKAEKSRDNLSDLEERLQRLEQLKSRLSRLRETNQENMILPNATYPQMAHAANTISNASLRNDLVQNLRIEDVDDEMDANRNDTGDQVLLVYSAIENIMQNVNTPLPLCLSPSLFLSDTKGFS